MNAAESVGVAKCEYCPLELCAPLGKYDRCDCECHPPRAALEAAREARS